MTSRHSFTSTPKHQKAALIASVERRRTAMAAARNHPRATGPGKETETMTKAKETKEYQLDAIEAMLIYLYRESLSDDAKKAAKAKRALRRFLVDEDEGEDDAPKTREDFEGRSPFHRTSSQREEERGKEARGGVRSSVLEAADAADAPGIPEAYVPRDRDEREELRLRFQMSQQMGLLEHKTLKSGGRTIFGAAVLPGTNYMGD